MAGRNRQYSKLEEIGNRRISKLITEYENHGFFCYPNLANNSGVDLIVMSPNDQRIVEVIESTNYARRNEWINEQKFERYVSSLNDWNPIKARKTIVVSYISNLSKQQIERLKKEDINIRVEQCQD